MKYQWDNKKPTAQMLGRWQPFHDGHFTLFKEIIKKTGQVCIQIRDVQGVDDNPFDFETVKKNIEEKYAMVFSDNKASLEYFKNINGLNIKFDTNYELFSEVPDYGMNLKISSKF